LAPKVLDALKVMQPETVIRWHRARFRTYWRWEISTARRSAKDRHGHSPVYAVELGTLAKGPRFRRSKEIREAHSWPTVM